MINYGPGRSQIAQLVVVKGESSDSGLRIVDRYPGIQISTGRELILRSTGSTVIRTLVSHQCGPGSIPVLGFISKLSLSLVFPSP